MHAKSHQSCLTLCDPVDFSPFASSVHGILQARILEWVAMSFSRRTSKVNLIVILGSYFFLLNLSLLLLIYSLCFWIFNFHHYIFRYRIIFIYTSWDPKILFYLEDLIVLNSEISLTFPFIIPFSSFCPVFLIVQSLNYVWLFATPWILANQASLFFTIFWNFFNSCPLSWWYHPTISSSIIPFSSCLQSFPASVSFPISWLFTSGGESTGASASASVLPGNIKSWFPLRLAGLISLLSKGLSVFSSTTLQKHQFGSQPFLWSNYHICTWLLEKSYSFDYRKFYSFDYRKLY